LAALVDGAFVTVVKLGVSYGISVGLEALGVDPIISGLVSSIVTGGITGFFSTGGIGTAFKTALQYGLTYGAGLLGEYFDFDPVITNILSMATSVLSGAWIDPGMTFSQAMEVVAKNVACELVYYGVQFAGTAIGAPTYVTDLIGTTLRSSLQAGLGTFGMGGGSPGDWLGGALDGGNIGDGVNL